MNRTLTLLLLLLPVAAGAQDVASQGEPLPFAESLRLRAGIGSWVGYGQFPAGGAGGGGLSLQAGAQLDDRLAIYLLVQGATIFTESLLVTSAMIEAALNDSFAIATGMGVTAAYGTVINLWPFSSSYGPHTNENYGVVLPLRLTFTIGAAQPPGAWRNRFFVALDGLAGYTFAGNTLGPRGTSPLQLVAGLSLGWQLM